MKPGVALSVLIVDDEPMARRRMRRMLAEIDGVAVVGEAGDGHAAVEAIDHDRPDVVLLDVRMPGLDGIAVARELTHCPAVIFTTAHADFALEAFSVEALDYLLKPVDPARLRRALERARERIERHDVADLATAVAQLAEAMPGSAGQDPGTRHVSPRVTARRGHTVYYFDPREIDLFQASEKYVGFVHQGARYLTEESLSSLEKRLEGLGFQRVHRSVLLRADAVRGLHTDALGASTAELVDGSRVPVSRRRLPALRSALDPHGQG